MSQGSTSFLTPARIVGFLIGAALADWIVTLPWWGRW